MAPLPGIKAPNASLTRKSSKAHKQARAVQPSPAPATSKKTLTSFFTTVSTSAPAPKAALKTSAAIVDLVGNPSDNEQLSKLPKRSKRTQAAPVLRAAAETSAAVIDLVEYSSDDEQPSKLSKRFRRTKATPALKAAAKTSVAVIDVAENSSSDEQPTKASKSSKQTEAAPARRAQKRPAAELEEEDQSNGLPRRDAKRGRHDTESDVEDPWDHSEVTCPIFVSLCRKVRADGKFEHIVVYIEDNTVAQVWRFVNGMVQSNRKLRRVVKYGLWKDIQALLAIAGNVHKDQIGWYADFVTAPDDDQYLKKYVGQTENMSKRMRDHKNEMKKGADGRQLHYKIAGVNGRIPTFVLLGTWTEDDIVPFDTALLDLVEMYFALIFQSLQVPALRRWLPDGAEILGDNGLNVAPPLYQSASGFSGKADFRENTELRKSSDPEVRSCQYNITPEDAATGRESMRAQNYVALSQGQRNNKGTKRNTRAPVNDSERSINVKCSRCGNVKTDPDPMFTRSKPTRYVTRAIICTKCPPKSFNPKTNVPKYQNPTHKPVDSTTPTVSLQKVDSFADARSVLKKMDESEDSEG